MSTRNALGQPIKVGDWCGHSIRTSGVVEVTIGRVKELTEGKAVLENVCRGRGLYEDTISNIKVKRSQVTLVANSLFPVESVIMWDGLKDEDETR
jgi:hypothetical protein